MNKLRKARPDELQLLVSIDDEASVLYKEAGLNLEFEDEHPFVVAESARWRVAIDNGLAYVAVDGQDSPIGFMSLCMVDNEPYLDQVSVKPGYMGRGIGTELIKVAIACHEHRPLWLTTYSHVPWNRPYYERLGFVAVPENLCKPALLEILKIQRAALPKPGQRIAMVRNVGT